MSVGNGGRKSALLHRKGAYIIPQQNEALLARRIPQPQNKIIKRPKKDEQ